MKIITEVFSENDFDFWVGSKQIALRKCSDMSDMTILKK